MRSVFFPWTGGVVSGTEGKEVDLVGPFSKVDQMNTLFFCCLASEDACIFCQRSTRFAVPLSLPLSLTGGISDEGWVSWALRVSIMGCLAPETG